jgi:hypothetical protein
MKTYFKIHLKHKVEQWKLGASMKNLKEEFGISRKKKNLESLENKD